MKRRLALALGLTAATVPAAAAPDAVERALADELVRTMRELTLPGEPRPHFAAFRIDDIDSSYAVATTGAVVRSGRQRRRLLAVELRVGTAELDDTNFLSLSVSPGGGLGAREGAVPLPLADDYREIRRQLWLAADAAYKSAVERFAEKRAALKTRQRVAELADFAPADPGASTEIRPPVAFDQQWAERLVRRLSAQLAPGAVLQTSRVELRVANVETRWRASDGGSFTRLLPEVELVARVSGQAADGRPLQDGIAFFARSLEELPPAAELEPDVRALGQRLEAVARADTLERYNGPVLFTAGAAAELLVQGLAPRLAGVRRPLVGDTRLEPVIEGRLGVVPNDKLGARLLPRALRLVDDATLERFAGEPLRGGYAVDDEGVAARRTELVENGILKRLLATRNPSPGAPRSTGNRRGIAALPSNLLLSTSDGASDDELAAELLELAAERDRDFAIVVERIANPLLSRDPTLGGVPAAAGGGADTVGGIVQAHRRFADGRREPLRNLEIRGLGIASFKDIVRAGQELVVYTAPMPAATGLLAVLASRWRSPVELAPKWVSVVTPALLFDDLTLALPAATVPLPPVAPPPPIGEP